MTTVPGTAPPASAALLAALLAAAHGALAAEGDVPGSSDHPDLGRFAGSVISGYERRAFDEYPFHTGPLTGGEASIEGLEGSVEQIAYITPEGASVAEVYRNYRNRLEQAGYRILFECETRECGGREFAYAQKVLPLPRMMVDSFNFRYLAARAEEGGQTTSVAVVVSPDTSRRIRSQVSVVVAGELEDKMVDAEMMQEGLEAAGHIALYGIYFDTDRAVLRPESGPTLAEIARLLGEHPQLRVILVGHTDNRGSFEHNRELSLARAQAVVDALVRVHALPPERLRAEGVGYLAPVATNRTEEGRALNRRVELVEAP